MQRDAERTKSVTPIEDACAGLVSRPFVVPASEVVYVKGLIEASEGLANLFAERGGELTIATTASQEAELVRFLEDLAAELSSCETPCRWQGRVTRPEGAGADEAGGPSGVAPGEQPRD